MFHKLSVEKITGISGDTHIRFINTTITNGVSQIVNIIEFNPSDTPADVCLDNVTLRGQDGWDLLYYAPTGIETPVRHLTHNALIAVLTACLEELV